jgi:hypothetical protein
VNLLSPALLNTLVSVLTVVLLAASGLAAFVQLRHMRAGNELAAVLAIERDFRRTELQAALRYVQNELPAKMEEVAYRSELGLPGYVDARTHPEMILCNWFDRTGALVRRGFVKEDLIFHSFGRLIAYYWDLLAPVVAVLRRTRGVGQYAGFEYLAYRARLRQSKRGNAYHPGRPAPAPIADPWLEEDRRAIAERSRF